MSKKLEKFKQKQKKEDLPEIETGDEVKLEQRLEIGGKEKIYPTKGLVIAKKHGDEPSATITVRQEVAGVGVEKIIPIHSPTIENLKVTRKGNAKKSKLYFLRDKSSKEIRRKIR